MRRPRVMLFDSGVGGLSIAGSLHQSLPWAELVYVADNAAFPYGGLAEHTVIDRTLATVRSSLDKLPCDVLVVACNTASTVALPALRAGLKVPVVGVVPAIKPAAQLSVTRHIGLLATPATVRRPYLDELIENFAADCRVERLGIPELVHWIERLVAGSPLPGAELCEALTPLRQRDLDTVVLGCTHYPLIAGALRECLPDVRFWVDSGEAIARRTAWLLDQQASDETAGGSRFDTTPNPDPVLAVRFSGNIPAGLVDFMAALGLGISAELPCT
ncbi:MAG: glutamate racemase [Pseudomonadota bacterium]|nr:glutamate racemase [Pseudomonadota bacterium]